MWKRKILIAVVELTLWGWPGCRVWQSQSRMLPKPQRPWKASIFRWKNHTPHGTSAVPCKPPAAGWNKNPAASEVLQASVDGVSKHLACEQHGWLVGGMSKKGRRKKAVEIKLRKPQRREAMYRCTLQANTHTRKYATLIQSQCTPCWSRLDLYPNDGVTNLLYQHFNKTTRNNLRRRVRTIREALFSFRRSCQGVFFRMCFTFRFKISISVPSCFVGTIMWVI